MNKFNLFDTVKLNQEIKTYQGRVIPKDTIGTIVEIHNEGEAYEVELFGSWIEYNSQGKIILSDAHSPNAFMETIAVETLYTQQITLVKPASQTVGIRAQLSAILDELSEEKLNQVRDFVETLR
ncbi:DUF4926 domain-containing protein [Synechocystis salina LEGE 06099]|uniref:DUF4926 domain-containing protein n=1 Tax=Synechocystis salina TaxID=945780 RepID=UPI001880680D|nr:DUF4926 domain-containing protein [Synechocystis salina]MBE9202210.1 DUF4926 domain-containing protein [Synechocystis salina LEGE 06099]